MKDNKSSLLLVVSLLLLSLSLVLLSIWGYQFFNGNERGSAGAFPKNGSSASATDNNTTRDSLMDVYSKTISKLDSRIVEAKNTADSLIGNVDARMNEIDSLKKEIRFLLKNKVTSESLASAREKINELKQKVEELQNRNALVEKENEQLKAMLQQYNKDGSLQHTNANSATAAKLPVANTGKATPGTALLLTGIRVNALFVKDDKDQETLKASEAQKINGSFTVKTTVATDDADIFVEVLQPNGKVVQNSDWDAGTFETPEGRKIYSQKIHTRLDAGEEKLLHFSLSADSFDKGNYTVMIYYNGLLIGKLVMSLS